MATTIGSGLGSLNAARGFSETQRAMSDAVKKLASGKKINSASDYPAGLVISERMNSRLAGLGAAATGNETSANMLKVADATLGAVGGLLREARSLLLEAGDSSADGESRAASQKNLNEILKGIDQITGNAQFGAKKIFDGSLTVTAATSTEGDTASLKVEKTSTETLGAGATVKDEAGEDKDTTINSLADLKDYMAQAGNIDEAVAVVDKAISQVSEARAGFGAMESDFLKPLGEAFASAYGELSSAAATYADADMAKETARVTGENLRSQVKMALIAQGKDNSKSLMQLLM